jgi:oligopeptide transport system ATP-binding protein
MTMNDSQSIKKDGKLLRVENLTKHFPIQKGIIMRKQVGAVRAVDGITFDIRHGETFGLVGESGCGKSTTGRTILRLYQPTDGKVFFNDIDVTSLAETDMRRFRPHMQMIFQDPYASLNPRMSVREIIGEPLLLHFSMKTEERAERVAELLELVGMNPRFAARFPHEFSGGQRQRIGIARALASAPEFIVCDEPISALDVSIQAQVVNLLQRLQDTLGLTYLFIAHDLSMVRYISDRMAVMYVGKLVEISKSDDLYESPLHPYTQALLSAIPIPDPVIEEQRQRIILKGDVPSPIDPPPGCRFHTRCPIAEDICSETEPELREIEHDHWVACHLV